MLDFQVSQFPFRFGLAEGTEPHQAQPGTLTTAENVVWKKSGRIEKRFGTSALVATLIGGGSIAAASRLFSRGSELCLVDGTSLYAYSPTAAGWRNVGKVPNVGVTSTTIVDTVGGVAAADSAISAAGLRVDAWMTGSGPAAAVFLQVSDVASDSVVLPPTLAFASTLSCIGVRVLVIGTTAIILTQSSSGTLNISAVTVNLSTYAVSAVTNLRTDQALIGGSLGWDACVIGSNFVISYTATGPLLKLYSYNTSLVQQASGGITGEASGAHVVSIDGASGEVLYVLYSQGVANPSPIRIAIANSSTLAQTVAPVTIETPVTSTNSTQLGVCRYDATHCVAAYRLLDGTNDRVTTYQITSSASVTANTLRGTFGTNMLSRPFMLGGACYMLLTEQGTVAGAPGEKNTVVVEVELTAPPATVTMPPHRYVGCVDAVIGGSTLPAGVPPCGVAVSSSTSMYAPVPFQSTVIAASTPRQGLRLARFTSGASRPTDAWRAVVVDRDAFLSSSVLTAYDGRTAFDYGFPRSPVFYSLAASNGAGSMVIGTYLYGATLEYRSATGLLYRSPTQTTGGTVTLVGAEDTVTVKANGANLGNKQTNATLFGTNTALPTLMVWHRTVVGGSVYYRLTVDPFYNVSFVDQTAATTTFTDLRADADAGGSNPLAARPTLYTTGGILDDFAPPGCVTMAYHADRLWSLAGDQKTWWYSKAFQDDLGVAPGFHPSLRISFAETQVAMASMDDKAIFFSATGVKYMLGIGPAPSGLNSDFQTPTTIQSDVGCTSARSVVTTPDGVMFLSARGLYLLDRGLNLSWIGRPVKDTLALYPTVTSAVLVAKRNQVRFTCNSADGLTGVVLVYDYVEKLWAVSRYFAPSASTPIADACMWNGAWTFVTAVGIVYTESEATYLDNGTYVPMTLETAWISGPQSSLSPSAGPLKFQSVRSFGLNGTSHTDHDLTISVGFDSNTTYQQTATFLGTSAVTSVGDLEECTVTIGTRRKCGSIRFKIQDATPTSGTVGIGQGPSFDVMAIEVGNKRGIASTPATKRG